MGEITRWLDYLRAVFEAYKWVGLCAVFEGVSVQELSDAHRADCVASVGASFFMLLILRGDFVIRILLLSAQAITWYVMRWIYANNGQSRGRSGRPPKQPQWSLNLPPVDIRVQLVGIVLVIIMWYASVIVTSLSKKVDVWTFS
jgi:hypothetical protein